MSKISSLSLLEARTYYLPTMTTLLCAPQNSCVETPSIMVCGAETVEELLDHEVGALMNGIHALVRRGQRASLLFPSSEDIARRQASATRKRALIKYQIGQHLDLGFLSLQNYKK